MLCRIKNDNRTDNEQNFNDENTNDNTEFMVNFCLCNNLRVDDPFYNYKCIVTTFIIKYITCQLYTDK